MTQRAPLRIAAAVRALLCGGGAFTRRYAIAALALASAFGLKLAYSKAGASELEWVLAPSCWLASALGGISFTKEAGAGFITHSPRMVVGAACAGVNFMVVCWLALFFAVQHRFASPARKLGLWAGSLLAAYIATIATNGLRIVFAAQLYALEIDVAWLTPARLHRLLGVVLYCSVLFGVCRTAELATRRLAAPARAAAKSARFSTYAPLFWYLSVALGVPLANRALTRDPAHYAEHAVFTLGAGLAVALAFQLIARLVDRLSSRRAAS